MTGPVFVDTNVLVYPGRCVGSSGGQVFDAVRVVSPFALPNRTPSEVLEGLEVSA